MEARSPEKYISEAALDRLIAAHDGDMALVYLYSVRNGGLDAEQAAAALCRTLQEIRAASEKLQRLGLLPGEPGESAAISVPAPAAGPAPAPAPIPEAPAEELPQYSASEIARRAGKDELFALLLQEAEKVFGRSLNSNDMRVILGIYDHLGLPCEVVMVLLNYCAELCRQRYGDGRRPTAGFVEKQAYVWARQELLTLEQAEDYIAARKARTQGLGRLKELLGIYGRDLSAGEQKSFAAWLEMGFPDQVLELAYQRTIDHAGSFKHRYMNRILESWKEQGLMTVAQIQEKDTRRQPGKPVPVKGEPTAQPVDMDKLRELLEQI